MTSLKGHSGRVTAIDMSANDKFLASVSDDRSMMLWPTKQFSSKDHRPSRGNVNYDHGAHLKWSPDGKAIVVHKETTRTMEVYKLTKKEGSDAYTFQAAFDFNICHDVDDDVVAMGMDAGGKFIMSCSGKKNDLALYDLKGNLLNKLDTFQMTTNFGSVSPCGKFVAACGFTPDVKVWSVKFTKAKEFDKIARAFELTGHTSGIYHFAWRNDSARMATVSKDGTWRVYDTHGDQHMGQDVVMPKVVNTGKIDADETSKVAISPDGQVLALSKGKDVKILCVDSGKVMQELSGIHSEPLTGLMFDAEGRWVITSGDKHIRVFHNVIGFRKALDDFEKKLAEATTEGHKERLLQQISELKTKLKSFQK